VGTLFPVPNKPSTTAVRRAARVLALMPAIAVTGATGAAFADAPDSWAESPSVPLLRALVVYLLIPLGLFVLITLLVYIPSMSRSESYQPGQVWRGEPTWFGGPRQGLAAVEATPPAAGSDAGSTRGGTSGRW
jgi:hypothetical protein